MRLLILYFQKAVFSWTTVFSKLVYLLLNKNNVFNLSVSSHWCLSVAEVWCQCFVYSSNSKSKLKAKQCIIECCVISQVSRASCKPTTNNVDAPHMKPDNGLSISSLPIALQFSSVARYAHKWKHVLLRGKIPILKDHIGIWLDPLVTLKE